MTVIVDERRVRALNGASVRPGAYVLYWMQRSQRAEHNHALEYAAQRANEGGLPLVVGFGLTDGYPDANLRHYRFMLEGLRETRDALEDRGAPLVVRRGEPDAVALELAADAALVVCDRGYLRHQKAWCRRVAAEAGREVVEVESDVVVPVDTASGKAEYAARTLRPKLHRHLDDFIEALEPTPPGRAWTGAAPDGLELDRTDAILNGMELDRSVPPVSHLFTGGTAAARGHLERFLKDGLHHYVEHRNQPPTDSVARLSPYLHFGQVSPVAALLRLKERTSLREDPDAASFLEELVVRRELAMNWAERTGAYDDYGSMPAWARKTLAAHANDPREHRYDEAELERAATHDPYWNAAMREMRYTGYMHNYMRMYWGKKILEWTEGPEAAFGVALRLNNRYLLDGRDPNSFAGVGWVFGLHDRPWGEREIFGTVRYMSAAGLTRKTDPEAYVAKVDRLVAEARAAGVRFDDDVEA